jgi:thiamine biosynthesis protein ThiS
MVFDDFLIHKRHNPSSTMQILVNGESQERDHPLTVTRLLESLDLRSEQVAVEVNLKILDRSDFATWNLEEGDKIEILSFIGGGSPQPRHRQGRKRYE